MKIAFFFAEAMQKETATPLRMAVFRPKLRADVRG